MISRAQQHSGRRTLLWFGLFNSMSFTLVTGNMISLYLLRLGAGNTLIGITASFAFVSFFFLLPGRLLVPRTGVMRLFAWAWMIRYLALIPILTAPALAGAGRTTVAFFLVGAAVFGFHAIRGMGIVANTPMFNGFSDDRNRGQFISQFQMIAAVVSILGGGIIALLLGPEASIFRYLAFLSAGMMFGLVAAALLFSLPELEDERDNARHPLGTIVRNVLRDSSMRHFLFTFFLLAVATGIGRSFLVLFAKQAHLLSDRHAFLMVAVGNVGTFVAGYLGSILLDRIGARPFITLSTITYMTGLAIATVVMPVAPGIMMLLMVATFLLASFGFSGAENSFQAYFFGMTKPEERLNLGVLYFIVLGLGGTVGALAGGVLLDLLGMWVSPRGAYSLFFGAVLILLGTTVWRVHRMPALGADTFRNTVALVFSMRDLRAVTAINRLERSESHEEERRALRFLSQRPSSRAERSVLERLYSPSYAIRSDALDLLLSMPYSPEIQEALIAHLDLAPHTTASQAARILGLRGTSAAVPALRTHLDSEDLLLAGRAAIALCRLGDTQSLTRIRRPLVEQGTAVQVLYAAAALQIGGSPEDIPLLFRVLQRRDLPRYVTDEIILAAAHLLGCGDWFYPLYSRFTRGEVATVILAPFLGPGAALLEENLPFLDQKTAEEIPLGDLDPAEPQGFLVAAYGAWIRIQRSEG